MKAKIGEKLKKHSVAAKIIPAVAMLATSAVMLSTATYAWFTLGKEVKVTGLNMTATSSEGIEISLASVTGDGNALNFVAAMGETCDTDDEKGWKSSVVVGNYYSDIGQLKPASSCNGTDLFYATDATNHGQSASTFKAVVLNGDMAEIATQATLNSTNTTLTSNGGVGYYVDIPVHLRTSKVGSSDKGDIYCKLIINNNDPDRYSSDANVLYKAVRVAFIPITTGTDSTTTIFGCDKTYYTDGQAVNGASARGSVTVVTDSVSNNADFVAGEGYDSGLNIPYAVSASTFGHLDFYVRVWLEGESTYCYDGRAGQSWNIDLAFSLGPFQTTT